MWVCLMTRVNFDLSEHKYQLPQMSSLRVNHTIPLHNISIWDITGNWPISDQGWLERKRSHPWSEIGQFQYIYIYIYKYMAIHTITYILNHKKTHKHDIILWAGWFRRMSIINISISFFTLKSLLWQVQLFCTWSAFSKGFETPNQLSYVSGLQMVHIHFVLFDILF